MNLIILIHYQYQHLKVISFYYSYFISIIFVCFLEYVKKIIRFIGMQPCEQSDKVPKNKIPHTLYLADIYRGGHDVFVRVRMVLEGTLADYPSTTTTITIQLIIFQLINLLFKLLLQLLHTLTNSNIRIFISCFPCCYVRLFIKINVYRSFQD